jgi:hypothetical protein
MEKSRKTKLMIRQPAFVDSDSIQTRHWTKELR